MRNLFLALSGLLVSIPAVAADTYDIDPVHSTVLFSALHFNASHFYGRFDNTTGVVVIDEANPAASKIEVITKVDSISTWDQKRNDHLKSPDFFNAAQFPTIKFVSKSFKKTATGWAVTGDFTLHGVTKPLTVEFTKVGEGDDPWGGHRAGWEGQFSIKRSDYGMTFMNPGIGDDVKLIVSLEGVKKK
ncbi:MAG: YceI family protein [Myxococcota bacterium]